MKTVAAQHSTGSVIVPRVPLCPGPSYNSQSYHFTNQLLAEKSTSPVSTKYV